MHQESYLTEIPRSASAAKSALDFYRKGRTGDIGGQHVGSLNI
jgi:hypothetical protein